MPVDAPVTASHAMTTSSAQTVKSAVDKSKGKATELSIAEYQSIIESLNRSATSVFAVEFSQGLQALPVDGHVLDLIITQETEDAAQDETLDLSSKEQPPLVGVVLRDELLDGEDNCKCSRLASTSAHRSLPASKSDAVVSVPTIADGTPQHGLSGDVSSGSYFAHGGAAAQPLQILEKIYAWPAPANAQEDVTLEQKDTIIKQLRFLKSAKLPPSGKSEQCSITTPEIVWMWMYEH
ncbi:hypothetical protein M436DRAFT_60284 [Aureobasidium namibiae CBS 147.97]|uniref:Uncharacterized protein n=1 Tax=Aureobasidium namibiae CBS 147.97 TaxID=1043004 RepID=A0A074WTH5_9PEZI